MIAYGMFPHIMKKEYLITVFLVAITGLRGCVQSPIRGNESRETGEFQPSKMLSETDQITGKQNQYYCSYDETRNKIAILIKEKGIYDDPGIETTLNQYFATVRNHLSIDNVGVRKFSGTTTDELDKFIENLIKNDYVGYIILVGMDLPILVNDTSDPFPGDSRKVSLDLDNLNTVYAYVEREQNGCVDVAISFVVARNHYTQNRKREFIKSVFLNFISYHNNPADTYSRFSGRNLVIRDPEFFGDGVRTDELDPYRTVYFYNPVFLSNWDHSKIDANMKNHPLVLSYYVHGGPVSLGLGLNETARETAIIKGGSVNPGTQNQPTYVTTDEISEFSTSNGQISLFVNVLASCNLHILDLYQYDYQDPPNIQRVNKCGWPQTWLETGVWAVTDVLGDPTHYSFERWVQTEKVVGKALRKTHHNQGMVYGDILATYP